MSYAKGSIVWYFKAASDPDINYAGDDPIAATVVNVISPTSADVVVAMANDKNVQRAAVPLVTTGSGAARPFAMFERG